MSKDKISDYSATANSNTDIGGIDIDEGCAPSGINNAIRTLMKQLKDFQQGTNSDPFNGPVNGTIGATTPAAGSFTTLSASSTLSVTGAGTIQGLTVGKGAGSVATNTAVGASALAANTSGSRSVAVGDFALAANTTGYRNVALGSEALTSNTTGYYNTGLGWRALNVTTTGNENTASGYYALLSNTTGSFNTAHGGGALQSNTTANGNTAVGYQAAYANTTGANNVSIGNLSMADSTTGASCVAVGDASLRLNTTGNYNTAIGQAALRSNTTASNNTAVGYQAGYSGTTGAANTLIGKRAGYSITTGYSNTCIGFNDNGGAGSGEAITTGTRNTILGPYSGNQGGLDIRTSSNWIVLSDGDGNPRLRIDDTGQVMAGFGGFSSTTNAQCFFSAGWSTNSGIPSFIGNWATTGNWGIGPHAYNTTAVRIGNVSSSGWSGSYPSLYSGAYTNASDYRIKENVQDYPDGAIEQIMALRPVSYKVKDTEGTNTDGTVGTVVGAQTIGFIAHEVQAVIPELVLGTKDEVTETGEEVHQGLDYSKMVTVLVKAIQELNAKVDAQAAEISALKGQA